MIAVHIYRQHARDIRPGRRTHVGRGQTEQRESRLGIGLDGYRLSVPPCRQATNARIVADAPVGQRVHQRIVVNAFERRCGRHTFVTCQVPGIRARMHHGDNRAYRRRGGVGGEQPRGAHAKRTRAGRHQDALHRSHGKSHTRERTRPVDVCHALQCAR